MKKHMMIFITIFLVFSLSSCSNEKTIRLTSNSQKESPSTVLSIEAPEQSSKKDLVVIKVGVGKRIHSQYNLYNHTILSIDAPGVIVDSSNDLYSKTFDLTQEEYLCDKDNNPQYFVDIPLNFGNCTQLSGTITIKLISYFSSGETNGASLYINYMVENGKIIFSAR
ncbi:MAG: hypothetical protein IJU20_05300 [Clostridia bacterium]|nr:hypothetical protein [Clostridia bacterium]